MPHVKILGVWLKMYLSPQIFLKNSRLLKSITFPLARILFVIPFVLGMVWVCLILLNLWLPIFGFFKHNMLFVSTELFLSTTIIPVAIGVVFSFAFLVVVLIFIRRRFFNDFRFVVSTPTYNQAYNFELINDLAELEVSITMHKFPKTLTKSLKQTLTLTISGKTTKTYSFKIGIRRYRQVGHVIQNYYDSLEKGVYSVMLSSDKVNEHICIDKLELLGFAYS